MLYKKFRKSDAMEDGGDFGTTIWEYLMTLNTDVLVLIFQRLDIFESSSSSIADFANAWHRACADPPLSQTLDFSMLKSNYIRTREPPYVYVATQSDRVMSNLLNISMRLSKENIRTLIFHYDLFLSNDQFTNTAKRCPRLRRLVLPAWNRIKRTGMCEAICGWKELESLTMPSIANPSYLLEQISKSCTNFRELKIMGPCDIFFAESLAEFLPELKVLSLRCSTLYKHVLIFILENLKHLEVLNVSHCILMEALPPPQHKRIIREIDVSIRQKASRLREFLTCMNDLCIMCQRTRRDEGLPRWHRYKPGIWKADEVSSLAL